MKKIKINPGCISCGTCAYLAPKIFEVTDISRVKEKADIELSKEQIKEAIRSCPMEIIQYQDEDTTERK